MDGASKLAAKVYTAAELQMLKKLDVYIEGHTLRYAKIDFLYWFEFQNKCSHILDKCLNYLGSFESNEEI